MKNYFIDSIIIHHIIIAIARQFNGVRFSLRNTKAITTQNIMDHHIIIGIPMDAFIHFENTKKVVISANQTKTHAMMANRIHLEDISRGVWFSFIIMRIIAHNNAATNCRITAPTI